MLKISRLADYAVVILAALSKSGDGIMTAATVSSKSGMPEPTVAKVLKLLAKGDLVSSLRGAGGGYKLARSMEEITIAEIIMAVDGPISLTACVDNKMSACDYACHCPVKGRWDDVNLVVKSALQSVTLASMTGGRA